jgi:hypothetical protein
MLAVMKPKSKISFSALAPLLATMEDDAYSVDDKSRRSKSRHRRDRSIVDRVKDMLMGDNTSANIPEEYENERADIKLLDMQSIEGDNSTIEDPADFSGQPVRELPNQLVTEAASIVQSDDEAQSRTTRKNKAPSTHQEELRCVIAIVRHGDRTPKQKLKGKKTLASFVLSLYLYPVRHIQTCSIFSTGDINGKHFLDYFHDHAKGM